MFNLTPWKREEKRSDAVATRAEFEPFVRMRDEFDRLFGRFLHGWPTPWDADLQSRWGFDVEETGDQVVVRAEAPGFDPEDFDLQVRGNQLVLRASRKAEHQDQDEHVQSWQQAELARSITLPDGTDPDKVDARYRNGVLTITLPRTRKRKGKRIAIKQ